MKYKVKYRVIGPDQIKRKYLINLEEGAVFPLTRELLEGKKLSPGEMPMVLCELSVRDAQLYVLQSSAQIPIRFNNESGTDFAVRPGDLMDIEGFTFEFLEAPFINNSGEETRFVDVVELGQHLSTATQPQPKPQHQPLPQTPSRPTAQASADASPSRLSRQPEPSRPVQMPQARPQLRVADPPPGSEAGQQAAQSRTRSAIMPQSPSSAPSGASSPIQVQNAERTRQTQTRTHTRQTQTQSRTRSTAPVPTTPSEPPAATPQNTGFAPASAFAPTQLHARALKPEPTGQTQAPVSKPNSSPTRTLSRTLSRSHSTATAAAVARRPDPIEIEAEPRNLPEALRETIPEASVAEEPVEPPEQEEPEGFLTNGYDLDQARPPGTPRQEQLIYDLDSAQESAAEPPLSGEEIQPGPPTEDFYGSPSSESGSELSSAPRQPLPSDEPSRTQEPENVDLQLEDPSQSGTPSWATTGALPPRPALAGHPPAPVSRAHSTLVSRPGLASPSTSGQSSQAPSSSPLKARRKVTSATPAQAVPAPPDSPPDTRISDNPYTGFTTVMPPLSIEQPGPMNEQAPIAAEESPAERIPEAPPAQERQRIPAKPHSQIPLSPAGRQSARSVPPSPQAGAFIDDENPAAIDGPIRSAAAEDGTIIDGLSFTRTEIRATSFPKGGFLSQASAHFMISVGISLLAGMAFGYLASMSLDLDNATICVIGISSAILTSIASASSLLLNGVLEMEGDLPDYCRFFAWVATGAVPFSYFFKFPPTTTLLAFAVGTGASIFAFERAFHPRLPRFIAVSAICSLSTVGAALLTAPASWEELSSLGHSSVPTAFLNVSPHASEALVKPAAPSDAAEQPVVQVVSSPPRAATSGPATRSAARAPVSSANSPELIRQFFEGIKEGNLSQVQNLVERMSVSPEASWSDGRSGLMLAVALGRRSIAEYLLSRGADINAQDHEGDTALMWAVARRHPECVRLLLKGGANPAIRRRTGDRAIDIARHTQQLEMVRMLLETKH